MPSIDDQLRTGMRKAAPQPAGADDLVEHLGARKRRRARTRKLGTVGLVVAVLAGTLGGFVVLGNAFRTTPRTPAAPQVSNGSLVVNITNEDAYWLSVLPAAKQDLTPSDGAVAADREVMRGLVGSTGSDRDVEPAVSPNGNTVAFVHHDFKGPGSLWTVDIDGSDPRQLVDASVDVASPTWSPDGGWIAFSASGVETAPLGIVRPDATDLHYISFSSPGVEGPSRTPAWSPDGASIVFSSAPTFGDGVADIWLVSPDGTGLRNLTRTPAVDETDPAWSSDGTSIAFVTADGIEQIPADGGSAQLLVPTSPIGDGRLPTSPAWSPDGAYLTFVLQAPLLASTVYVLPAGGSDPFPLAQGFDFAWQPVPAIGSTSTPPPVQADLGLGYAVCRVSSMPITVTASPGTAYVFTKQTGSSCPKASEGTNLVGVDMTGDGTVDATSEPLTDCFFRCEAFAAPDVNADGTSEVAVSTEGADGYGVWLFAVTDEPPAIGPIHVDDPQGIGYLSVNTLQFAWVDVAGHSELARCDVLPNGATFTVQGVDKLPPDAVIRSTVLRIVGTSATVVGASHNRAPIAEAPAPGKELCGTPLYGSAANFPNAAPNPKTVDVGLDEPLCDVSTVRADFDGDGAQDTAWVGTFVKNGRCGASDARDAIVAVDLDGDGLADASYATLPRCLLCQTYAATDLNADGASELVVLLEASSTPEYAIYGASSVTGSDSPGMFPMLVSTGNAENGFPDGSQLTFTAGGDEGYSSAVRCEGFPAAPVLVLWRSEHPVEGPGADVKNVYETKLRLVSGSFAVVDARHFTQPTSDPSPFGLASHACGVDWFSLA